MNQALEVFIKVVEEQNFSKAARQLHMSQPAVSQYIRSLETEMGVKLLERTNKYVRLNKAGEIVYHHAKEVTELYGKMHQLVKDLSSEAIGKLSIGSSYTFGEYILPGIIAEMKDNFPGIEVTVTIANTFVVADMVANHRLDAGIVEGHFPDKAELHSEVFAKDRMVVIASPQHKLTQSQREITIDDLKNQNWILREVGSGTREAAEDIFRNNIFFPASVMQFNSTQPIKSMVEAGAGISLLSEAAIQKEVRYGDLKVLNVSEMPHIRDFALLTNSHFQTKALSVFIDILRSKGNQER